MRIKEYVWIDILSGRLIIMPFKDSKYATWLRPQGKNVVAAYKYLGVL